MAVSLHFSALVSSGFSISRLVAACIFRWLSSQVTCKTFYLTVLQLLQPRLPAINFKLDFQPNRPSAVCGHSLKDAPSVTDPFRVASRSKTHLPLALNVRVPFPNSRLSDSGSSARPAKISGKRWQVAFKCRTFI